MEDYFPLHNFPELENLRAWWKESSFFSYFISIFKGKGNKNFKKFNSIAFYYGSAFGFYFSFTSLYVPFLLIVALIGSGFSIRNYIKLKEFDSELTFVFYICINLWVTLVFEKWKQRESELKYLWNTGKVTNEKMRVDFVGYYSIDEKRKVIKEESPDSETRNKIVFLLD